MLVEFIVKEPIEIKTIELNGLKTYLQEKRSNEITDELEGAAAIALAEVRRDGIKSIQEYNQQRFGAWNPEIRAPKKLLADGFLELDGSQRGAMLDFQNQLRIKAAAQAERLTPWNTQVYDLAIRYRYLPIDTVGIYSSPDYPTTVMNVAAMAKQAGVRRIVLATYPKNGALPPGIRAGAFLSGIDDVFVMQGKRAIAALATGLDDNGQEIVPRANMICGPGGPEVDATKRYVNFKFGTRIDLPAGPSEVGIIATAPYDPKRIALEMACQCEHGSSSSAFWITDSTEKVSEVFGYLDELVNSVKEEKQPYVRSALNQNSRIIRVESPEQARYACDLIAPELVVVFEDSSNGTRDKYSAFLRENPPSAGSICFGFSSALGDYGAETCITPTNGLAACYSKLYVNDF
ncbi:histidinol dehydrogenase, partial [Candidatus Peregrinibacteria bacterium]|nr:histidinol dehydrogenase [Candidatus Peregrinibacteria bacterium]